MSWKKPELSPSVPRAVTLSNQSCHPQYQSIPGQQDIVPWYFLLSSSLPKRQLNTVHTSSNQGPEQQCWYFPHHNPKSPFVHFYLYYLCCCDNTV